jgi:RNA polymerase sigma-70 factor (ECF subfamily)
MKTELLELVKRVAAADGHEHMEALITAVQPRLRAYILRCTLNEDLTEDVLQETMLQLLISLKSLKNPERFWPWLFKIASNKIISHFRNTKRHSSIRFSAMENHILESALQDTAKPEAPQPALKEMYNLVMQGMESLTAPQRSVLALRCFEGLQYQEIAEAVGCSESTARVQFLRARKKLNSSLVRRGFSKKAALPALVLFGKLTAGQKALAASITPASVVFETGFSTGQAVTAAIRAYFFKTAAATAAVAAIFILGQLAWDHTHPHLYPLRNQVQSVHYTVQGIGIVDESQSPALPTYRLGKGEMDTGPYFSKGAYEQWLRFPDGPDGPVFVRMQRWSIDKTDKQCAWLQNGHANYYYHSGERNIYITNDPIGMLMLPTDPPEMTDFLLRHIDYQDKIKYARDRKTGLLKSRNDNRVQSVKNYITEYAYNSLSEKDFAPFWPHDAGVVDQRDPMHYRGWTYFIFEGKIGDRPISGKGRLPLFYAYSREHTPWLEAHIGDTLRILDTPGGACMIDERTGQTQYYPAGTFFVGLGRPWTGIRAYDTLQRDAAAEFIPFASKRVGETGRVQLERRLGRDVYKILYTINMEKDVIMTIQFSRSGALPVKGRLQFTYAQQLEDLTGPFEQPQLPMPGKHSPRPEPRHWLLTLMESNMDSPRTETATARITQ